MNERKDNLENSVDVDYFVRKSKRLIGKPVNMSQEEIDFWVTKAKDLTRPRTPEEMEILKKDIRYPGLPPYMRVKYTTNYYVNPRPKRFFGIKIGWWY